MKSKLGTYVINTGALDLLDYVSKAKPQVIVSMDSNVEMWRQVKAISPNTFIVGRYYVDDGEQVFSNPEMDAQNLFNRMAPEMQKMGNLYDAWMGYNESVVKTPDEASKLSRFYVAWGNLMRQAGFKSGAYSFSNGNPELDLWKYLEDGLAACDYLFLHEYSAPSMQKDAGWRCLRYRQVYGLLPQRVKRPLVVTETGIDGGSDNNPQWGWQRYMSEEQYLNENLKWYDAEMQKDPYVIGGVIFALAGWGYKGSFSIIGADKIRDYMGSGGNAIKVDPSIPAVPVTPTPPTIPPVDEGWCPFAVKKELPVKHYFDGHQPYKAVVIHIAEGSMQSIYNTFSNPARSASSHFAVSKTGVIEQYVSLKNSAWANGLSYTNGKWYNPRGVEVNPTWSGLIPGTNPNYYTISIEHEGFYQEAWTPEMYYANDKLLKWLATQFGFVYESGINLIGHNMLDPVDRPNCPGSMVDLKKMATDANGTLSITFSVDNANPQVAEKYTLSWKVYNAKEVYLDGLGVIGEGTQTLVAVKSTTHTLKVVALDGSTTNRNISINVKGITVPQSDKPTDPHLASFPRPQNDNGRGIHFILDSRQQYVEQYAPYLKKMKISWATVYGGDEAQCIREAKYLKDNFGIFSNMRVYASGEKPKTPDFWQKFAEQSLAAGVPPYIQIFNEPEDGREGFNSPIHFASMWGQRADAVVKGGGFPGLQVLSEEFLVAACVGMSPSVKDKFYFSLHNYGANHPPKYPYPDKTIVEDDTAVLRFFAFEEWFRKYLGFVPPMLGGEGGWLFKNHDDVTMPEVSIERWIEWHYEMFEWFRRGVVSNGKPLPDYLFSVTPWLLWASNWYSDSWVDGLHSDEAHADENSTPNLYKSALIDRLANDTPYTRKFGGIIMPTKKNDAQCIGNFMPSEVKTGETLDVSVVLKNSGTATWRASESYRLGATSVNQLKWIPSEGYSNSVVDQRIFLKNDVAPQGSASFSFKVVIPTIEGVYKLSARMVQDGVEWFGEECTVQLTAKKEPTPIPPNPTPPDNSVYVDSRCQKWISYKQGTSFKLVGVYFFDSKPVDDPESEGGVSIRVSVVDTEMRPLWHEKVTQSWPDGKSEHYTRFGQAQFDMSGDSSFDPNKGQVGAYTIIVGDLEVRGFGLPLRQHVEYGVEVCKLK